MIHALADRGACRLLAVTVSADRHAARNHLALFESGNDPASHKLLDRIDRAVHKACPNGAEPSRLFDLEPILQGVR